MSGYGPLRGLPDDGHFTPTIKQHSVRKIELHNYYVSLFTTSMKDRWPQRAYLGLYSGAGRARLEETGEILETTALSALRVRYPFTKYIFVDHDPRCIDALRARIATLHESHDVSLIQRDLNEAVPDIIAAMPPFSRDRGLLSFCFIDPFSAELDFDVIRTLGTRFKMDFLILLMLGRDVRTNFRRYLEDQQDTRIARLIDDSGWRRDWSAKARSPRELIRFLLGKFDEAMQRIGYRAIRPDDAQAIMIPGKNVFLYSLVLYSKSELGQAFWQATREATDPQRALEL
jgi:three-Cys-motif partner protein